MDSNKPGRASRNSIIVAFKDHAKKMGFKFRGCEVNAELYVKVWHDLISNLKSYPDDNLKDR